MTLPEHLTSPVEDISAPSEAYSCYHCQDACPDTRIRSGDKVFCCNGCKTVYEILETNQLCTFYNLDDGAGRPLRQQRNAQAYAYLDDPDIQAQLLDFRAVDVAQASFYLPQMHCVSCLWLLEQLGRLDAGITHSRVNFLKKTVTIQFDPTRTSLRRIVTLLASIGYEPEINLGDVEKRKMTSVSQTLALQIAVAGFAFGNIMLFSFPEYVGMDAETYRWFANIFGYLSLALALPVLLFSARDYFRSAWRGLLNGHLNIDVPLCLALSALFGRSVWEILAHTGAGYLDSFAGLTFLLLIGKWFQQITWNRLSFERDYKSYFPVAATVRHGDAETTVPVQRLVPGDVIVVRSQEIIPADGMLLKGEALIDYSFVTGEATPVTVRSGERIFAGGKQLGAAIELSLTKRVSQSHLTKLWNNAAFQVPDGERGVSALADQAGRFFSGMILTVGTGALLYWALVWGDWPTAINAFTAVMIVACPCMIALSIPFTLGNIVRLLGREGFYLKNSTVVEGLANVDAVVFDKTGTITQNLTTENTENTEFHGVTQNLTTEFHGVTQNPQLKTRNSKPKTRNPKLKTQNLIKSLTRHSTHPHSRRICAFLGDIPVEQVEDFLEIPGLGIQGWVDGCFVKVGAAAFVAPDFAVDPAAGGNVYVSVDGELAGWFVLTQAYRPGLAEVLAFFSAGGASVWLLSGDNDREAAALSAFFPDPNSMFFGRSPQDKLDFVKKLQRHGQRVLMVGDGLNDAGALRQSDVGIVMAENTNNFTPACEAILHAGEFARLPVFIRLARAGVRIVWWSYGISLFYNIIGLSFAVTGALSPLVAAVLMPASSVSVVLFGVGMGNWAARRLLTIP